MIVSLIIIVLLVLLNAVFATGELALVSCRKPRLEQMAKAGSKGAERALKLAEAPTEFLPTVQIGMTLVSILEGTFGSASIESRLSHFIASWPALAPWADQISMTVVVAAITFVMLVFGELVPKQIALQRPEAIASALSIVLVTLAKLTRPFVWFLNKTSTVILHVLGFTASSRRTLTEEELRAVLLDGMRAGVIESGERAMIERLLRLADRPVRAVMTPRSELFWIDRNASQKDLVQKLLQSRWDRVVVCDGDVDHPVGVILAKDIMERLLEKKPLSVEALLRVPPAVPDSLTAQAMIERLRGIPSGIVFVLDEYGTFEGIVTSSDIFEAIIGDEPHDLTAAKAPHAGAPSDDYVFEGFTPADEVCSVLDIPEFPEHASYHTLGGALMALLKRVPSRGDKVVYGGWLFEVLEMDKRRVVQVRATRQPLALN
ncbi:HlyC/CorC family transporter [Formicincola oecophyllae]|uniref:HlyC/CorC family transporter n=1 Tax=Formicincola oecophyllae TaxID=2558361 RepID=A0A4Y6U8D3_9PROT|nr:hemolysin family protein [Formicincola oecophyllae]QDH13703.1 HlyC/CorC family transporter [Formicincola oecophyllae]